MKNKTKEVKENKERWVIDCPKCKHNFSIEVDRKKMDTIFDIS